MALEWHLRHLHDCRKSKHIRPPTSTRLPVSRLLEYGYNCDTRNKSNNSKSSPNRQVPLRNPHQTELINDTTLPSTPLKKTRPYKYHQRRHQNSTHSPSPQSWNNKNIHNQHNRPQKSTHPLPPRSIRKRTLQT